MMHWYYNQHENDEHVNTTEHIKELIKKVILHCPKKFQDDKILWILFQYCCKKYNQMTELEIHKKKKKIVLKKNIRIYKKRKTINTIPL